MPEVQGQAPGQPASPAVENGQVQGQPAEPTAVPAQEPNSQSGQPDWQAAAKHFQSVSGQKDALIYQLQAQLQELSQQRQVPVQQQSQGNPYDYATDFPKWWEHEQTRNSERMADLAAQRVMSSLQEIAKQQQESQWQQSHPDVDINAVKAFARVRGIQNYDDAYMLMTFSQRTQGIANQAVGDVFNQIRQPQVAAPVRGGTQAPVQGKVSFEETLKRWMDNPAIESTWTPEFKADFERELMVRQRMP